MIISNGQKAEEVPMCGIFGILLSDRSSKPDESKLVSSARLLQHRGPDAHETFSSPGIGLAHTRLSFLDLDPRANQPFWDPTGRYALVFNGEIYDFKKHRARLEGTGVTFATSSDTEVLLHALLNGRPEQVLRELSGMFAFALYDSVEGTLTLGRDRFGMKPLFLTEIAGAFVFASEVKAFEPWRTLEADRFMVSSYLLRFRGPTKGFTMFDGVRSLGPGEVLRVHSSGERSVARFFALPDFLSVESSQNLRRYTARTIVDHMDELLTTSVNEHMFADVPVGAFCSGGVDSSLLMALAARSYPDLAVFHANVVGPWSERDAASHLAKHLGLELRVADVHEDDFLNHLPRAVRHFEGPIADRPNCIPLMLVAELARRTGVKGLLSGEGSDECFLGYPWLGRKRLTDACVNAAATTTLMLRRLPGFRALFPSDGSEHVGAIRTLMNRREIADDEGLTIQALAALPPHIGGRHTKWTLDYLHHHLRVLLHRNDTMGMAASIEARFPFLDLNVVQAAVNMPGEFKLRFAWTLSKSHPFIVDKWVVRQVADRYLPRQLSQRPKFGFWTTVFQRLEVAPAYFNGSYINDLFSLSRKQMNDFVAEADSDLLSRLFHIDIWGKVCLRGIPHTESVQQLKQHVRIRPLAN